MEYKSHINFKIGFKYLQNIIIKIEEKEEKKRNDQILSYDFLGSL